MSDSDSDSSDLYSCQCGRRVDCVECGNAFCRRRGTVYCSTMERNWPVGLCENCEVYYGLNYSWICDYHNCWDEDCVGQQHSSAEQSSDSDESESDSDESESESDNE